MPPTPSPGCGRPTPTGRRWRRWSSDDVRADGKGACRENGADTVGAVTRRQEDIREPAWRQRAVSRSLEGARSRAEQRVQGFLDAAFSLIDEKGSTDFTIQEIIDRSGQSLRGFYQHFEGKDDLLLALFDETLREAADDLQRVVASETEPMDRLRSFTIRLYEWCDPDERPRKRGSHNRRPIMDFMLQLAASHPERVKAAMGPVSAL